MARNDIRPFRPASGGTQNMVAYPLVAGQDFEEGEPVVVGAAGTLAECATNPATVSGISAASSQGKTSVGTDGTRPTGTMIQIYTPTDEQLFVTQNLARDGAGTAVTPLQTDVADLAGFTLASDVWYVDSGAVNQHVEIVAVLDSDGQPIGDSTIRDAGTGLSVVFVFV